MKYDLQILVYFSSQTSALDYSFSPFEVRHPLTRESQYYFHKIISKNE